MCFVYPQAPRLGRCFVFEDISRLRWRVPKASIVDGGDRDVLSDSLDPGGKALNPLSTRENHGDLTAWSRPSVQTGADDVPLTWSREEWHIRRGTLEEQ